MPDFNLTLIAPPHGPALSRELVTDVANRLNPLIVPRQQTLGDGEAIDIGVRADDAAEALRLRLTFADEIRDDLLEHLPVDVAWLPDSPHRRKHLLIADMESTIIEQEMLDELADCVGLRETISGITARAMRGELDFEAALRERVGLLAGLDAKVLDEVADRITLMPGAETLIRTMQANGAYCALVSGGFTVFTERVAKQLGFDEHQANVLEIADGKLTGRVLEPILGGDAKLAALRRLTAKLGIDPSQVIAVGDGANDLAMLAAAGLGVAFRAKPKVREAVAALPNGAVINHGDLTALLYLQGYRRQEFVG